ncbi:MAG: hypothetical protein QX196_12520, partial [Methylococcaceae bacterium]
AGQFNGYLDRQFVIITRYNFSHWISLLFLKITILPYSMTLFKISTRLKSIGSNSKTWYVKIKYFKINYLIIANIPFTQLFKVDT